MRVKATIEYDGSFYCGFQRQFDIEQKTVEEVLQKALFSFCGVETEIVVCGRTDAGVHALGQVINFDLAKSYTPYQVMMAMNHHLKEEAVKVLKVEKVSADFHARFDTKMRYYQYLIVNRSAPLVIQKNRAWQVAKKLDIAAMQQAANFLLGEHDFSSFRDSQCQASNAIRRISEIIIEAKGEEILVKVAAKSFLHHMVRNIVGTLVYVGLGKFSVDDMPKIIAAKDRTKSGPNAPAHGLYFLGADY